MSQAVKLKIKVLRLQGLARRQPKVSAFDNLGEPKASIFDDLGIRLNDVTPFESAEINDLNKNVLIKMERKTKMSKKRGRGGEMGVQEGCQHR